MSLTIAEYQHLMALEKIFDDDSEIVVGPAPKKWERIISSTTTKDKFILNYYRGAFEIRKYALNKRYHGNLVMIRYCSFHPHTNPPGTNELKFQGAHVHIFDEKYGDKIAYPPKDIGIDPAEPIEEITGKILSYCNIINSPLIRVSLF